MHHPLLAIPIYIPVFIISVAFGRMVMSKMRVETCTSLERSVFGLGIGFGALSYCIFLIGILGFLYTWSILAVVLAMGASSAREIPPLLRDMYAFLKPGSQAKRDPAGFFMMIAMAMLAALAIIPALAPSSGLDWDGLAYHLAIPKIYLRNHSIIYVPFTSHSNFPFLTEMLYTLGLSVESVGLAKLFHFAMYIGTAAAIYSVCARHLSVGAGRIAALLFMSVPVVAWEAGVAYTDLSTGLYIALAVYALLNWEQTRATNWLIACGITCGFAFGTKVLAGIPIVVLCIWILLACGRLKEWGRGLKLGLMVGCTALIIGAPWYIKSFVYTGNPFYPFLYGIFGGRFWSQEAADAYRGSQLAFGMGRGVTQFIVAPWNLLANGVYFFDVPDPKHPKIWGLIGPAFMGLIPICIYTSWKNRLMQKLAILTVIFAASWFVLMQYSRYLITIVPVLCIMAGYAADQANRRLTVAKHAVNAFIILCVLLGIFNGTRFSVDSIKAAMGIEPANAYLARTLDVYGAESWINRNLPDNAKIVIFDEVRGFYLDREYMWGNPGHHEMIPWKQFHNAHDMVTFLIGQGYGYALINMTFASVDSQHIKWLRDAQTDGYARELFAENGVSVLQFVRS